MSTFWLHGLGFQGQTFFKKKKKVDFLSGLIQSCKIYTSNLQIFKQIQLNDFSLQLICHVLYIFLMSARIDKNDIRQSTGS